MTNNERTIELYRCDYCKTLFETAGGCHGHMTKHFGLIERLVYLFRPNVRHFVNKTTVVTFEAIERQDMEEI